MSSDRKIKLHAKIQYLIKKGHDLQNKADKVKSDFLKLAQKNKQQMDSLARELDKNTKEVAKLTKELKGK